MRNDSRVKNNSNSNGKSAGASSDAGEAMVVDFNDINSMLHQQELLAAVIARNRNRERLNKKIQHLMAQRDNDVEPEDPRKGTWPGSRAATSA